MKGMLLGVMMLFMGAYLCFAEEEHPLFTRVLKEHVWEGRVDYPRLCQDPRFKEYIDGLAETDPEKLESRESKLVFWINAYNALTLSVICDNYPLKSITQLHTGGTVLGVVLKTTVWDKDKFTVNNRKISLNEIEHKIIRPIFKDPRIHFAIVCAAKGCPPLRSEAYEADKLDEQLDEQGQLFLSQEKKNSFDLEKKVANISPVFGWFKQDFGTRPQNILSFITRYLPQDEALAIQRDLKSWRIRYTFYDWSLNE